MVSGDPTETAALERRRDRMARELRVRGLAKRMVSAYVDDVRLLVERLDLHPARLTEVDLKACFDAAGAGAPVAQRLAVRRICACRPSPCLCPVP